MNKNRISLSFTDEEKGKINGAVKVLNDVFAAKLIALSKDDKAGIAKISDDAIPFMEKVAQYVVSNPEFIPMFGDAGEFTKDLTTFRDTREFGRPLMQIVSNLDDTAMLSGSEADDFARRFYGAVGQATKMGVPNAQAIYDDLSVRYEAQKKKRPKGEKQQ
ncbi:MAG: hypothetical protein WA584_21730 [Pyrinomonadaceae bacterium]